MRRKNQVERNMLTEKATKGETQKSLDSNLPGPCSSKTSGQIIIAKVRLLLLTDIRREIWELKMLCVRFQISGRSFLRRRSRFILIRPRVRMWGTFAKKTSTETPNATNASNFSNNTSPQHPQTPGPPSSTKSKWKPWNAPHTKGCRQCIRRMRRRRLLESRENIRKRLLIVWGKSWGRSVINWGLASITLFKMFLLIWMRFGVRCVSRSSWIIDIWLVK